MCKGIRNWLRNKKHKVKSEGEIAKAKTAADEMLQRLYEAIYNLSEDTVSLYDRIEDYFFQDIDFQMIQGTLSLWMADAGRSPESGMSRVSYDKCHQIIQRPRFKPCHPLVRRTEHHRCIPRQNNRHGKISERDFYHYPGVLPVQRLGIRGSHP